MIEHQLSLDYTLTPGWMKPFIDGLIAGKAKATKCVSCARVSYPPQRTCECGEARSDWVDLPGAAEITFRTTGSDGDFGLVQFDGAHTHTVIRLEMGDTHHSRGQIARSKSALPMMILEPIQHEAGL